MIISEHANTIIIVSVIFINLIKKKYVQKALLKKIKREGHFNSRSTRYRKLASM